MKLRWIDVTILVVYLLGIAVIGFLLKRKGVEEGVASPADRIERVAKDERRIAVTDMLRLILAHTRTSMTSGVSWRFLPWLPFGARSRAPAGALIRGPEVIRPNSMRKYHSSQTPGHAFARNC
jgi:hypothetical protein